MQSIRQAIALSALSLALTACATRSSPAPDVHPVRIAPALCAKPSPEPKIPDDAGIPVAVTEAEKAALTAFLGWTQTVLDWSRAGWSRAERTAASEACR